MRCPFESTKYGGSHSFRADGGGAAVDRSRAGLGSAARAERAALEAGAAAVPGPSDSAGTRSERAGDRSVGDEVAVVDAGGGTSDAWRAGVRLIARPPPR